MGAFENSITPFRIKTIQIRQFEVDNSKIILSHWFTYPYPPCIKFTPYYLVLLTEVMNNKKNHCMSLFISKNVENLTYNLKVLITQNNLY